MAEETKKIDFSDRVFVAVAAVVIITVVVSAVNIFIDYQSWAGDYSKEITVSAEGKAYVRPDVAITQFSVVTEGDKTSNTEKVVKENTEKMNAVISKIKELGVEEKDIQTTAYNLSPQYDWTESGRIFLGYILIQEITVKIRDFGKIGDILDSATEKGANEVGNLQFTVDDAEKFKAEARAKAIDAAKEKARTLVEKAGLKLGKITNVYEDYYCPQSYSCDFTDLTKMGAESETVGSVPEIQSGELEITATINLTYRIK